MALMEGGGIGSKNDSSDGSFSVQEGSQETGPVASLVARKKSPPVAATLPGRTKYNRRSKSGGANDSSAVGKQTPPAVNLAKKGSSSSIKKRPAATANVRKRKRRKRVPVPIRTPQGILWQEDSDHSDIDYVESD